MASLLTVILSSTLAQAAVDLSVRDRVYDFLKANVMGRSVSSERLSKNADCTIELDFKSTQRYYGLQKTENGLVFDRIALIKQTNYDLDKNGARTGKSVNKDRELVSRTEVAVSLSTGKLVGANRIVSMTITDPTGLVDGVVLDVSGDKLTETIRTVTYLDMFAAGNTYKPGRTEMVSTYQTAKGKLEVASESDTWFINPDTFEAVTPKQHRSTRFAEK